MRNFIHNKAVYTLCAHLIHQLTDRALSFMVLFFTGFDQRYLISGREIIIFFLSDYFCKVGEETSMS